MVMNDHYKGNSFLNYKVQKSPNRGKNQVKASCNVGSWTTEMDTQPSDSAADVVDVNESRSSKLGGSEPEGDVLCLHDRLKWLDQQVIRKGHQSSPSSQDRAPYERMLDNKVEFGSPNKRSSGFFNSALN
ncbi:ATP-dependent zinc metalloprotease FTSH 9, chloroplastic [Glycine soja]|uniref:ATP-dependent zinc metalloprotease FTSH 9, chloroplastic n=1 Tax=Glycine soja TaxID=3848 RepID=A0A0B2P7Q1_GLYSO|nr:ATP-dependent zinc metalloprotease FTSH 9, chloroplastic [Glycine soja]